MRRALRHGYRLPSSIPRAADDGFKMLFVGVASAFGNLRMFALWDQEGVDKQLCVSVQSGIKDAEF